MTFPPCAESSGFTVQAAWSQHFLALRSHVHEHYQIELVLPSGITKVFASTNTFLRMLHQPQMFLQGSWTLAFVQRDSTHNILSLKGNATIGHNLCSWRSNAL